MEAAGILVSLGLFFPLFITTADDAGAADGGGSCGAVGG